ncbi:MAG: transporter, partial [Parvularculaceae bacterium]|nr:transporter [Parvularculaceae bacterium]
AAGADVSVPTQPARRIAAAGEGPPTPGERPDVADRALQEQRRREPATTSAALPTEVGVRPADEGQRPNVAVLPDVGGILTPRGAFFVEPSFDYTVTGDNRFFFRGDEIVDAVLIGSIDATDSDRRAKTASLALRYGVTNRFEIDGRISYVDRKDQIRGVRLNDGVTSFSEFGGSGLGDAEIGLHYQLNRGRKFPYTVVNLRAKAPTGKGPFDLDRNSNGVETELATGSGTWTIEPSFTFILPSDPAVIFANVGYQVNLKSRPDVLIGTDRYVEFDPGEAVRASLGMGLSVNDKLSVSFGYDHTSYYKSKTLVERPFNGRPTLFSFSQAPAVVGSFLFGGSYTVNDRLRINFNTAIGATEDAPDVRASIRAQFRLFD